MEQVGYISNDALDHVFSALADPTRRAILIQLRGGAASVNELAAPFSMSQPAVSRHLKVLERAGLVKRDVDQQRRPASLNALPMVEAISWLGDFRRFWEANLDQLEALLDELQAEGTGKQQKGSDDE